MDTEKTSTDYADDINEHIKTATSINRLSKVMRVIIFIIFMLYLNSFVTGGSIIFKRILILILIMANAFIDEIASDIYGSIYDLYYEMNDKKLTFDEELKGELLITEAELKEIVNEKERDRIDFSISMYGAAGLNNELDKDSESILKYKSLLTLRSLSRYLELHKERMDMLDKKATLGIGALVISAISLVIVGLVNYLNNYGSTSIPKLILHMSTALFIQRVIVTRASFKAMNKRSKNFMIVEDYLNENK